MTSRDIKQLSEAVGEFTTDRVSIMASLGQVKNNGKLMDAVLVVIGHNPTMRKYEYVYRGLPGNFKDWLKKKIDEIDHK